VKLDVGKLERLHFLVRVVGKEAQHLVATDQRLFDGGLTIEKVAQLEHESDLAERVEAFVSRFGRLQDTLGDKLLPVLLNVLGEKAFAAIDNLDRAERLGFISSVDVWMTMRNLRNQMVHEYIEDIELLFSALQAGHGFVSELVATTQNMLAEIERRGW